MKSELFVASETGNIKKVEEILKAHDNKFDLVNSIDGIGRRAFEIAYNNDHPAITSILLDYQKKNPKFKTITLNLYFIMKTFQKKEFEITKKLLDFVNWNEILFKICELGYKEFLIFLLEYNPKNCDINATINDTLYTPLHIACKNGFSGILEILLKQKGIDPNMVSVSGTPLEVACRFKFTKLIKILLVNPKVKSDIKFSYEIKDPCVKELLENYRIWPAFIFACLCKVHEGSLKIPKHFQNENSKLFKVNALAIKFNKRKRFFGIASRLPQEHQMMICNIVYSIPKTSISSIFIGEVVQRLEQMEKTL